MDGVGESWRHNGQQSSALQSSPRPVAAIFVHAGAGYHSTTNEHTHLRACRDAAALAMTVLRSGGSAVAAVEAAIRVLEDKEITNAGYGSNLTKDGVVECDATMVDHLGRSGACGAVVKVKNPIHLARAILEASNRPLSLRRVPPNLLVGEGAMMFAWEHNVAVVPHDALVSRGARERFLRWREDLHRANRANTTPDRSTTPLSSYMEERAELEHEDKLRARERKEHTNAMLRQALPEIPTDTQRPTTPASFAQSEQSYDTSHNFDSSPGSTAIDTNTSNTNPSPTKSFLQVLSPMKSRSSGSQSSRDSQSPTKRTKYRLNNDSDARPRTHSLLGSGSMSSDVVKSAPNVDISFGEMQLPRPHMHDEVDCADGTTSPIEKKIPMFPAVSGPCLSESQDQWTEPKAEEDMITDTVGAIAIDIYGRIAAGSSSGGIGMKHRGRVGPAALVGIGSAVIPIDPQDPEGLTVAAVTSGTGEHMATTIASQRCAERLYYGTKRGVRCHGEPATEEEAMHSFVEDDFMGHPGVRNSHSGGAIGVMAVKKSLHGYYLHFAHNTDSFALASMHSNEKEPKCVMSRIGQQNTSVVQGARKIRVDR